MTTQRVITLVLRDDAPQWALIDIKHDLELSFGEETTYGRYVAEIKSSEE